MPPLYALPPFNYGRNFKCIGKLSLYDNIWLQIASLTLMKDSERLDLLKEIGGTRVYEERRKESLKIMQDTGERWKYYEGGRC